MNGPCSRRERHAEGGDQGEAEEGDQRRQQMVEVIGGIDARERREQPGGGQRGRHEIGAHRRDRPLQGLTAQPLAAEHQGKAQCQAQGDADARPEPAALDRVPDQEHAAQRDGDGAEPD